MENLSSGSKDTKRMTIDNFSEGQQSDGKLPIGQKIPESKNELDQKLSNSKLSVGKQSSNNKLSVGKQSSNNKLSVGKLSIGKQSGSKLSIGKQSGSKLSVGGVSPRVNFSDTSKVACVNNINILNLSL